MNLLRSLLLCLLLFLVLAFSVSAFKGRESLQSISVQFTGEGREHQDKYIIGINTEERAPDYTLEIRVGEEWRTLGTVSNTFSASKALDFSSHEKIPVLLIEEIRLSDQDKVEHDVLETLAFQKGTVQGGNYQFISTTQLSLMAGVAYFWHTEIGKAILAGITIAVFILILSIWN